MSFIATSLHKVTVVCKGSTQLPQLHSGVGEVLGRPVAAYTVGHFPGIGLVALADLELTL